MTNEKLKLNFPINGGDVFDKNNEESFFAYSGAFSNTTNNLADLSFEQLEIHIPMGYKSILLCRRTKLIDFGVCIKKFDFNENDTFIALTNNNYQLDVPNWNREIQTSTIYKPNYPDLSISSSIWENSNECFEYGLEYSRKNNCKILIASIVEIINWH